MATNNLRILSLGSHSLAVKTYNEHQQNTPMVFIHGITSSVSFWGRDQTSELATQRWYSLSLPGHYPSTFPKGFQPEQLTADLIADLTSEAIRQLVGDQQVILAGHSTGGFTTLAVAARHPEQIKAAVSISGFAHGKWTGALGSLQRQARMGALGKFSFKLNMRVLTSAFPLYKASLRFDAADRNALYHYPNLDVSVRDQFADAAQLDLDSMIAFFNRMPDIDITAWLPQIQIPMLVLAGDAYPIVPPDQARLIAKTVPDSTLHLFKGAGHLPMLERSDEYHKTIGAWIGQYL